MARINVTELFADPDFADPMAIIRRSSTVTTRGENLVRESSTNSVGCIQPTDGKTLKRLPEALRNEQLVSFWFKGEVGTTANCDYPSILLFRGRRYQIRHVFDWSNWGEGWSEGVCVAENLT